MPTYEYSCDSCSHRFEKFQSITASPLKKCPECGKQSLKRLIGTGAGVIFKGSGFYETDYRSESYTKDKKGASPKKDSASPKQDAKTGQDAKAGNTKGEKPSPPAGSKPPKKPKD